MPYCWKISKETKNYPLLHTLCSVAVIDTGESNTQKRAGQILLSWSLCHRWLCHHRDLNSLQMMTVVKNKLRWISGYNQKAEAVIALLWLQHTARLRVSDLFTIGQKGVPAVALLGEITKNTCAQRELEGWR